jgi:hypothetical protein
MSATPVSLNSSLPQIHRFLDAFHVAVAASLILPSSLPDLQKRQLNSTQTSFLPYLHIIN